MTDSIEFLNYIHNLQDVSSSAASAIETALELANAKKEDHIDMPKVVALGIASILTTQSKVIAMLIEENQTMVDKVEKVVQKIEIEND